MSSIFGIKNYSARRTSGVDDFWYQERQRIFNNEKLTRDWNQEQIASILNGKKPKIDGKSVQGHHSYSASLYPHLADKGEVIYPATPNEHFYNWHGAIGVIVYLENQLSKFGGLY